jgi:hypothetical protein
MVFLGGRQRHCLRIKIYAPQVTEGETPVNLGNENVLCANPEARTIKRSHHVPYLLYILANEML